MTTGTGSTGSAARQLLDHVADRWRSHVRRQLVARLGAGLAGIWLAAWLVDRFIPGAARAIVVVAAAALAVSVGYLLWQVWSRRTVPGRRDLARFVEDHWPALEDRLVTAVDVMEAHGGTIPSRLAPRMLEDADRAVSGVSLDAILPFTTLRRSGILAGAAVAACLLVGVLWVEPGRRALQTAVLQAFPGRFALTVSPGHARVRPDEGLTITARAAAPFGSLAPQLEVKVGDERRSVAMRQEGGDTFSWTFDRVPASFDYRVKAPGRSSDEYHVTLLQLPRVRRIDLHYEFPPYTRLAPRTEEDGGDIFAPSGTRIRMSVLGTKPLESAALTMADGRRVELKAVGSTAEGELVVRADGAYRVALADRDGLQSPGETEYFIRVLNDRPPNVRIVRPASDRRVTPLEEVSIEARADDDYGIAAFDLVFSVRGGRERAVPLADVARRLPTATGRRTLFLEDLDVEPGDFVSYYARARDVGRGKASAEARSDIFFLEVTPFEEEFAAAQSQAMAAAGGGQGMDDLIAAQKNIIVATWKLERRSTAGTSAADVDAVARAQGELRARAARLAQRAAGPPARRRGNPFGLPPGADPAGESAIAQAVGAMGRAEASLKARNTRAAIGPEMEALNHLLKALAEVRRREVMRQQAGFGGGNRAEQDLSALFDRELRRQQQTNYETPRTTEERREEKEDDVLDRVRELARRQEQLARQQDELARERDRMSAEERRRRLERLAREQAELRRLTEQAAQRAAQQSASASARQQGGSQAGAGSELREASEQMRQAASELRREDAEQARARAQQALDRLRSLERSMEGGQPDEQRRALGDLQLEARQLAERQRRISEQAAAASGEGDPSSERRRLAGEQDRVADRAGRMQERLREVATGAGGDESREEARGAATAVDEQQLVRRMRESARTLREAAAEPGKSAADAEVSRQGQEIARQLDNVAGRLEAGAEERDAEQQQIASELAEARRLREELGDLQRRMGELQRRSGQTGQEGQQRGRQRGGSQDGSASKDGELGQLQQEYAARARELSRLEQRSEAQQDGLGMSTPEGQSASVSAPGTEAFKQDFSGWERLHRDVTLRLERLEATLSQRLLERAARERVQAGSADTTPEQYEQAVDRYFRSLAKPEASSP